MSLRYNVDYKVSYKLQKSFLKKAKWMFVIEKYSWIYKKKEYDYDFDIYYNYSLIQLDSNYYLDLTKTIVASFLTKELAEEELKNFKLNSYVIDTTFEM